MTGVCVVHYADHGYALIEDPALHQITDYEIIDVLLRAPLFTDPHEAMNWVQQKMPTIRSVRILG